MMIILRGDVREGICSELNRGGKKVGKGARDLAWTRKIAGSFGPERPAHYIVLSFKLYEYLLDRRWDHGRIWRGWGYRGETDVWNEEAKEGRKEGRWRRGAECRIISGLHMRFVFQSIMFGAARTKGVPDPKRDAREKEKEEGKDLSEIVISCYYRTRQISRRNTRGPLPIKLSSSLRHGKPSFFPSPLQRNELKGSKGSRDQFARLSYVPIDAKYPTATSSIAVQYFLSNFLFSLFSPKGKKKKKTASARHVWKYRSIGKYIGGYWGLWAVGLNEGDKGGTVTRQHDYRTRSSPTTRCSATPTLRGLEWHRVIATPQPTIRSRRSPRNCYKSSALLVNIDPPRE